MLVCLSSGARAQYLESVLAAIAAPKGTAVQLRYSSAIVQSPLLKGISRQSRSKDNGTSITSLVGETALLCYLDRSDPDKSPEIIPYRAGQIEEANLFGATVILRVRLSNFAAAHNIGQFTDQAKKSPPSLHSSESEQETSGFFVFRFANAGAVIDQAYDITVFERVVAQLCGRSDFSKPSRRALFFHVLSIEPAKATPGMHINLLPPSQPISVREGQLNRITIYHYFPESAPKMARATTFTVAADFDPTLASFGGSETQTISSDYDVVHFDFRVRRGMDDRETLIRISAAPNATDTGLNSSVMFPVTVKRDYLRFGLQFAALWVGLSVATVTPYISGLPATQSPSYGTLGLVLVGALAATVGALTNLKFKI